MAQKVQYFLFAAVDKKRREMGLSGERARQVVAERLFGKVVAGGLKGSGPATAADLPIFANSAFPFQFAKIAQG